MLNQVCGIPFTYQLHNLDITEESGALGRDRTCDLRFRKPVLYPLSYEGGDGAKCGAKFAATSHVIYVEVT